MIRKLVQRLHQESDNHNQVAGVGEEVVPDTKTATTGKKLMRVDAPPMGEVVQTGNKKPTSQIAVLQDKKVQSSLVVAAGGKTVKQEHPGQDPYPHNNSIPLSDYMEGVENEQPYQFGMKHMQKHGWALGEGLGPQGRGIREFLQAVPKQNNHEGLRSDKAPAVNKGRNQQSSGNCIHKDTVAMPDGKRYDVTSTPRYNPDANAEYGEPEWQSGFPYDDPYLRKSNTKHAAWAKNGW